MSQPGSPGGARAWTTRAAGFIALLGFHRLLVGTDEPAEWGVGAIAATRAGTAAAQLSAWRFPAGGVALMRPLPAGAFAVISIDPGEDGAQSSGRRSFVVAGGR